MEHEIALICIVLIIVAHIIGRVGYAVENDKKEKSDYDKMNESINNAINGSAEISSGLPGFIIHNGMKRPSKRVRDA